MKILDMCAWVLSMLQGEVHCSETTGEMPRAFLYLFLWKYQAVYQMWWFTVWKMRRNDQDLLYLVGASGRLFPARFEEMGAQVNCINLLTTIL